ncbi:MAG: ribosome maturation factor RimP, partial [Cyclobacteriaceae bacterium]
LEEVDLFTDKYTIEVTSAGVEHPLQFPRQYVKNTGRNVKVVKNDQTVLEGKLTSSDDHGITVEVFKDKKKKATESVSVSFSEIEKTNVLVSFK